MIFGVKNHSKSMKMSFSSLYAFLELEKWSSIFMIDFNISTAIKDILRRG